MTSSRSSRVFAWGDGSLARRVFALGLLGLAACASIATEDVAPATAATSRAVAGLDMDELITRIPDVRTELVWNVAEQVVETDPAIEEMQSRLAAGVGLTPEQWGRIFTTKGVVRVDPRLAYFRRAEVIIQIPSWLPHCRVTLEGPFEEWATVSAGTTSLYVCLFDPPRKGGPLSCDLGTLPIGVSTVTFTLTAKRMTMELSNERWAQVTERRRNGLPGVVEDKWRTPVLWQGPITLEF